VRAEQHTITIDHVPVFYRTAPWTQSGTPLFLHTAPTSSDDWIEVLERTGGVAPDLIGFGRSGKGGHLDYSPAGIARFVTALLDELAIGRVALVGHGWGAAVAATIAAADPERVERLVLIDGAPPLQQHGWHRLARLWRRPVIGELTMGSITRSLLARSLRGASAQASAWPDERVQAIWKQFDQGTQRATLRLHRWATPEHVATIAHQLEALGLPSIVLWGELDAWFPPSLADAWVTKLRDAKLERVADAGHWPWLDQPELGERIAQFLGGAP
jgi:pimeloyl-ACP methyl ester carboxylesterase